MEYMIFKIDVIAIIDEEITISHRAQSKDIFANGALSAASKLVGKENGFFDFDNLSSDDV